MCDDMRVAVQGALARLGEPRAVDAPSLIEIDLDLHPVYEARYGEFVPVLLLGDMETGEEICHYHFDEQKWHRRLAA